MIKNYFVRGKAVKFQTKGLINYINYLESSEHKNHKGKTEKIYKIYKSKNFLDTTVLDAERLNLKKAQMKGKGGRYIKEYAQSFVFSPPEGVKMSKEEILELSNRIMKILSNYSKISKKELLEKLFINVHVQDNTHLNIVIGKVFNNKPIHWGKLSLSHTLKQAFNVFMLEVKGLDHKEHHPKPKNKGNGYASNIYQEKNKKKQRELQYQEEDLETREDTLKVEYEDLQIQIEQTKKDLIQIQEIGHTNQENKEKIIKYLKNMGHYIKRVIDARISKDKEKELKNEKLIQKGLNKLNLPQQKDVTKILQEYKISLE